MDGYIDIHNHILPQVDDGSRNMNQTVEMIKIAYSEGIRTMIATPHYREEYWTKSAEHLNTYLSNVKSNIIEFAPDMTLLLGAEIYYSHEAVNLLKDKQIPTMAGTRYVLVEFPYASDYLYIKNGLHRMIFEGYIPILAHVERYKSITSNLDLVGELIDSGVYIQVNAASLIGDMGRTSKKVVKKLLKYSWVHFIATDAHGDINRAPYIKKAVDYISKKYGESYINELLYDNPSKLIKNEYI